MKGDFDGQSALVTGGGSGIGLACAKAFARDGAHVTLFGRNAEKLTAAANEITAAGGAAGVVAGDTGVEADIARAVDAAVRAGRLTVAVANAGTGTLGPVTATSLEQWDAVLATNLTGTFLTFKHAGAAMAKSGGGALCAISSIAGARTHRLMGAYCVSKAGIDMLVRNSADELGAANVRVNSVLPGLVDTELAAGLLAVPAIVADYLDCMPIRRTGTVDDIAAAVRFLCGPEAGWITGVNLSVDGGHHLRRGPNIAAG
jgi:NAD(P)-dependent dehydrogenase (short-subunit alcohol dehydrogenase family)